MSLQIEVPTMEPKDAREWETLIRWMHTYGVDARMLHRHLMGGRGDSAFRGRNRDWGSWGSNPIERYKSADLSF